MEAKKFIDIICPKHSRTSCSDKNIWNGFILNDYDSGIDTIYPHRCRRCALLQIENGTIKITDMNKKIIDERLF